MHYFVKDKENLLPFNVWSGGEYNNDLTGITLNNMIGTVTKEWHINGESSFKFISNDNVSNFRIDLIYTSVGNTLILSIDCLNTQYTMVLKFYQLRGSAVLNQKSLSIPTSNNSQNISLSTTTLENITSIRVLVESTNHIGQTILVDNIQLSKR